jgi:hypothetical protein
MLSAFLIAAFASGCGGSGEEAAAIRQAIREAAHARGIHLPPAPSITIVVDRVSDARKALDDALSNISEDDRDAYKSAMCTALKTIGNGGTPDWEGLPSGVGLSEPAYEFRQATEDVQSRAEAGAPLPNLALWSFIDYACI